MIGPLTLCLPVCSGSSVEITNHSTSREKRWRRRPRRGLRSGGERSLLESFCDKAAKGEPVPAIACIEGQTHRPVQGAQSARRATVIARVETGWRILRGSRFATDSARAV